MIRTLVGTFADDWDSDWRTILPVWAVLKLDKFFDFDWRRDFVGMVRAEDNKSVLVFLQQYKNSDVLRLTVWK